MKARFRPPAEDDVRDAYAWYREQGEGLAPEFRRALDACVAQIERNPLAYPKVYEELRRALLRRFPYGIFYPIEPTEVVVHGVFHGRRDPKAWQSRYNA